jgi:hypothetical protein
MRSREGLPWRNEPVIYGFCDKCFNRFLSDQLGLLLHSESVVYDCCEIDFLFQFSADSHIGIDACRHADDAA